jgi:symplekin
MDRAAAEEKNRKSTAAVTESKKRPGSTLNDEASDAKRPRLEQDPLSRNTSTAFLASFDFTALPAPLVTELIVANLQAFTESQLIALVNAHRQSRGIGNVPSAAVPPSAPTISSTLAVTEPSAPSQVKEEPEDPLQMDIDEDELEYEPDRLNLEV